MSHFYGTLKGTRGEATRCGDKSSGITTTAASWHGAVRTHLYVDENGIDRYEVYLVPWQGAGANVRIAKGIVGRDPKEINHG